LATLRRAMKRDQKEAMEKVRKLLLHRRLTLIKPWWARLLRLPLFRVKDPASGATTTLKGHLATSDLEHLQDWLNNSVKLARFGRTLPGAQ